MLSVWDPSLEYNRTHATHAVSRSLMVIMHELSRGKMELTMTRLFRPTRSREGSWRRLRRRLSREEFEESIVVALPL